MPIALAFLDKRIVKAIARALLAGDATPESMTERAMSTLGHRRRWIATLCARFATAHTGCTRPTVRGASSFLLADKGFKRARRIYGSELSVADWKTAAPQMQPAAAAAAWLVPEIETSSDLADFLSLYPSELDWFADLQNLCRTPKLQHYNYRLYPKKSGGVRLIEAPKPNLKAVQRRILSKILDKIPPHPAAHGFVEGRSITTFTAAHTGQRIVVRMDLEDFFPSITRARIRAFFRTAGYPETVANPLAGLCTNATPRNVLSSPDTRARFGVPHLPQGAPTSPALANIATWRMDCRLTGLAQSAGAAYSRYADDLAFSGGDDFDRVAEPFIVHVAAIAQEEGFHIHHRKTRIMRQGTRQYLAGLVVNQRQNIAREEFDALKAILTNCARSNPGIQNREAHPNFKAHLEGRIEFFRHVNPPKGARLREIFDRIHWPG